jgi:hypothetical protein
MMYEQRMFARVKYLEIMAGLYDNSFENFFANLMCARYPDYLDIKTAGSLGDLGADGLLLHDDALYACYAPQSFDSREVADKFGSDLEKAREKRKGEFTKFVFVHNDRRGMHPQISSLLSSAESTYKDLHFSQMGRRHIWQEIIRLEQYQVEDLLGCPIPIEPVSYGVGMEELAPLLGYLKAQRSEKFDPLSPAREISEDKLDYNTLDPDSRRQLVAGMHYTHLVEQYYTKTNDETESPEVAAGFAAYYQVVSAEWEEAEDILWQMEMYVLGNQTQPPQIVRCAWIILAYFFERCYIFEEPPPGWRKAGAIKA